MKGYGFFYFIAEAFRGLRANSLVNLLAVGTISMAMLIVGFFLLAFVNLHEAVKTIGDRLEMSVYLENGISQSKRTSFYSGSNPNPASKKLPICRRTRRSRCSGKNCRTRRS